MMVAAARTHRFLVAVLVALALTAGVVAVAVLAAGVTEPTESVFLEAKSAIGASPFVPVSNSESVAEQPAQQGEPSADTPGSGDLATCDPAQLINYLSSHPDAAAAWVDALNSDPTLRWSAGDQVSVEQIPAYIGELTPDVLSEDSRVTNFQFVNGRAGGVQSILQSGTAVLIDSAGVPRVRCACGNPLTPMRQISSPVKYGGEPWSGFTPIQITIIVKDDDPDCDDDEYWDGDRCRPYRYCPDPMYFGQDGRCYFPADPCPPSWERDDNGRCYDPEPEYCPDGSVKRPGKECRKPVDCPQGYERQGAKCIPPPQCPSGYDRVGDECRSKNVCPDGKTKIEGRSCTTDPPPNNCPDGKPKTEGQNCTTDPPPNTCPDGKPKTEGQNCTTDPPPNTCPDGAAKKPGVPCQQPTVGCPPGQFPQGGVCNACVGPTPDNCRPSTESGAPAQTPGGESLAPKAATPSPPPVPAPKARPTPKAEAASLRCPDGTMVAATAGCLIPTAGVPTGWVQRGDRMFPAPK